MRTAGLSGPNSPKGSFPRLQFSASTFRGLNRRLHHGGQRSLSDWEEAFQLRAGDSVLAPRKVPHAFTAVGATPAKMLIAYSPAGKMEQRFRDIAQGKPVVWDAALARKYGCEFVGPPLKTT